MSYLCIIVNNDDCVHGSMNAVGHGDGDALLLDALVYYNYLTFRLDQVGDKLFFRDSAENMKPYTLSELKWAALKPPPKRADPLTPYLYFEINGGTEIASTLDELSSRRPGETPAEIVQDALHAYSFLVRKSAEGERLFIGNNEKNALECLYPSLTTARRLALIRADQPANDARKPPPVPANTQAVKKGPIFN
jgi:hypothetical protein